MRRERVGDGIAGNAEDSRRLVELIQTVEVEHGARRDLAGRGSFGFGTIAGGGESERGALPRAENAADQPLFAHGDADDVGGEGAVFNEAEDGEVVGQGAGGGDDLDEVGLEGGDAVGGLLEAASAGEVVVADEEGRAGGAKLGELGGLGLLGGFDFEVEDSAAGFGGPGEDVELGDEGSVKVAAIGLAAAGGDGGDFAALGEELLEFGQRHGGLGEGIEAELDEL